ncbi:MAG TPA: hypothetical protein VEA80_02055 [Vitreimonas sp.]|uniref:hypothetical protein n=1 Tax=Vitreimonas sp. TaxID=3069702 RepID=UPI002D55B53D|nr:hypothetical protein [Vitreimonas sp.]HYD86234.1 hypothetical protein [Vitreimonas sp.]
MADLAKQFDAAMLEVYVRAKEEAKYTASEFHNMLTRQGGVATAKQLINAAKPSDGYTRLYERGFLKLTVEAVVVENPKWHPLFADHEIERARARLLAYNYKPNVRAS